MRLEDLPESSNVEDRRGMRTAGGIAAGGGGILLLILGLIFGVDVGKLGLTGRRGPPPDDKYREFASKVVGSLEAVWTAEFDKSQNGYGRSYEKPKLVLFSDAVNTGGCGHAPSEVGPFYCPRDRTMYLDPTFFDELERTLGGSKAQFSQAYVIAHENGHHVQNLLGYSEMVDRRRGTPQENEYSIRLELQADYLAGVWAHHAHRQYKILEGNDLEEALKTALSIGDDRIMKKMGRKPWPEKFNHGTAEQRKASFSAGFRTGDASRAKLDQFFKVRFDPETAELDPSLFR
jgi:hypothetical protein